MIGIGIKELLEAGVHFGHQTRRWNPKMKRFIFDARNGIYIIDLSKTLTHLEPAAEFVGGEVRKGGRVLFVGTKKQAQEAVKEAAEACGPLGPDVVVQCADSAELDRLAVELAGYGGRVVFVGTVPEAFEVRASELIWRELALLGSRGFTGEDIADVIDLYLAGEGRHEELYEKLGAGNRAQAIMAAMRMGLIKPQADENLQ